MKGSADFRSKNEQVDELEGHRASDDDAVAEEAGQGPWKANRMERFTSGVSGHSDPQIRFFVPEESQIGWGDSSV